MIHVQIILDLDRSAGRLSGSAALAGSTTVLSFSGTLELVARIEELRSTATGEPVPGGRAEPGEPPDELARPGAGGN